MAGHRLAKALSDIIADTHVKVRQGLMRHEQEARARTTTAMMETWERELARGNSVIMDALVNRPDLPDDARQLLDKITTTTNQTDLFYQLAVIVGLVMGAGGAAAGPTLQSISNTVWRDHPRKPLPPDVAAALIAKRRRIWPDLIQMVREGGFSEDRFGEMIDASYEALPMGTALELWRKGEISESDFLLMVGKSGLDPAVMGHLPRLRWQTIDPGTATAARVESHIGWEEHAQALAEHGIDPKWADVIYETAGRPPGLAELAALMNRGLLSEATLRQAIAESDVKNKYADAVVASAVYLPPPRSIVAMMRSGAVDPDYGRELLQKHGLSARDAELFVREATHGKAATARHAAVSLILQAYQDFEIDRPAAERMLTNLSYDAESTVLSLGHAEALRGKKIRDAEVSRIRTNFDKRWIDRQAASAALDRAGVPSAARDQLLAAWDVEREVSAPHPTVAQLVAAYKKQGLDDAGLQAEILALGYSPKHAAMLMHSAGATPVGI